MGERIIYKVPSRVFVCQRESTNVEYATSVECDSHGVWIRGTNLDAAGVSALRRVLEAWERDGDFSALKPAPKIRPLNASEIGACLGRDVRCKVDGTVKVILGVRVRLASEPLITVRDFGDYTPSALMDMWEWPDGSPIGTEEA